MIFAKWKQCGVCARGKDHIAAELPCQDNVAHAEANGVHAVALSDGGGSRKYSEVGSAVATKTVCELLVARFDELYARQEKVATGGPDAQKEKSCLCLDILDYVRAALKREVTAERTMRDFGCALQFAAVKGDKYLVGHVGDGVIAGLYQTGLCRHVQVLSHPENGGAPNVTFFITDHDAGEHLRLTHGECRQLEGFLLMSDGPEEVLYQGADGMHPNTMKLFDNYRGIREEDYARALRAFLTNNIAQHSYDDLSLQVLYFETIEEETVKPAYREELFGGIEAASQVTLVGHDAWRLDATVAPCGARELPFVR